MAFPSQLSSQNGWKKGDLIDDFNRSLLVSAPPPNSNTERDLSQIRRSKAAIEEIQASTLKTEAKYSSILIMCENLIKNKRFSVVEALLPVIQVDNLRNRISEELQENQHKDLIKRALANLPSSTQSHEEKR